MFGPSSEHNNYCCRFLLTVNHLQTFQTNTTVLWRWKSLSKLPKRGRWVCTLLVKELQSRLDCEIIYKKVTNEIYIWERTSTTFLCRIWLNCTLVDKCHCNKKLQWLKSQQVTQVPTSPNDSFAKTWVKGSRVRARGSRAGVKGPKGKGQMVGWEGQGLG